jgi:4-amino-4-deoxy-L-arabinose transferase-like glycosyltransferase
MATTTEQAIGEAGRRMPGVAGSDGRRARVWRSPSDQPHWARPALLIVAFVAALAYAWRFNSATLEPFYGAAARSMSTSWHDFLFGAFDPAGTVTVDKLPGALWLQALSLRVFGFHVWVIVLPQVLEGVITILVLYRAVRRLAGPVAGITAAVLLALSPITVALGRGNVPDSLLIMLTVLAADATSKALLSGRLRPLLLAGLWVGLAFQAKMLQAWLVLPALAIAYLLAGDGRLRRRIAHVSLAGLVTLVVSLSWMSAVSLVAAHSRPYVDGSRNDSLFSQVFEYNGITRLGPIKLGSPVHAAAFLGKLVNTGQTLNANSADVAPGLRRMLQGLFALDVGWLYPAAFICAVGLLIAYRRADRRAPERACVVLWGLWLLVLFVMFSEGAYLNSYYVAALSPAIAAVCGCGVAFAAKHWDERRVRAWVGLAVFTSIAYGIYLLRSASGVPRWLVPLAACLAVAGPLLALRQRISVGRLRGAPALPLALTCALLLPAVACAYVVTRQLGPFNAPYESPAKSPPQRAFMRERALLRTLSRAYPAQIALGTYSSMLAAPFVLASGQEILPIGGFQGGVPYPTLTQLRRDIASDRVRTFLIPLSPTNSDPRILWIIDHCHRFAGPSSRDPIRLAFFRCTPAVAARALA